MNERVREVVWSLAASAAAVLCLIGWSLEPARPAGPVVSEQALCDEVRAGASPLRVAVLVQGGAAVHGGVQAAASSYVAGEGLRSSIVTACTSVGA
jgi:hypothetical protein